MKLLAPTLLLALLTAGAATQPTTQPTPLPKRPDVQVYRNLAYGPLTQRAHLLDLYVPTKPSKTRLPLIVWIHGGGWLAGSKDGHPGTPLAALGFASASIQYRFSNEAPFPAQLHDCKGAIRYLRAHAAEFNIDPDRIGVWGASAGGHLAALLGTTNGDKDLEGTVGGNLDQSSDVTCVIDLFGPTDLAALPGQLRAQYPDSPILQPPTPLDKLLGGRIDSDPVKPLAKQASPLAHVSAKSVPFLILQGNQDNLVPHVQSEQFQAALQKAGVEAELVTFPEAGHGGPDFFKKETLLKYLAFFNKHLKPTPTSRPGSP